MHYMIYDFNEIGQIENNAIIDMTKSIEIDSQSYLVYRSKMYYKSIRCCI